MNTIELKMARRFQYLKRLYELSQGDRLAYYPFAEVGRELGLDEATSDEVTDYLMNEKLIAFPTFGTVCITHAGVKVIERTLSQPSQPTNYFPALVDLKQISVSIPEGPKLKVVDNISNTEKVSILFLAADPSDASRLRLGEELREIQEKLQLAKQRERFELHQRMSVRPADISQALLDIQPQIVHFSGHGATTGALCFENQAGQTQPVPPDALAALFEQFTQDISCVILNACYSEVQAKVIAEHIENVVGMNEAIGDKAAIAFAVGFYQALGAGRSIEDAFKLGIVQIRLQGIPDHLIPVLIRRRVSNESSDTEINVVGARYERHKKRKSDGILIANISLDFLNQFPVSIRILARHVNQIYTPENFGSADWLDVFKRLANEGYFIPTPETPIDKISLATVVNPGPKLYSHLESTKMLRRSIMGLDDEQN
jgi:hypothetical protein